MNLYTISILIIFSVLSVFKIGADGNENKKNELLVGPYLQNVTASSITIMWETTGIAQGSVKYGSDSLLLSGEVEESRKVTIHEITLTDLKPATTYYYQCKWDKQYSPLHSFTSAPAPDCKNVKLVVYGDTRSNPEIHTMLAKQIAKLKPGLVLHSGDFVLYGTYKESWKTLFFDPVKPFCSEIPFLTVMGNHESNSSHFYNYFSLNNNESWWSTDYGPVHIIGLDSNKPGEVGTEQYNWLVNDLKKNKDKQWIIVMMHHSLFSSRPIMEINDLRWIWHPLFEKYKVDLVFNGHDHFYARSFPIGIAQRNPKGTIYVTSAGGGAPLYPNISKDYIAYRKTINHITLLEINDDQLIIKAIDKFGNIFDSYIINKNADIGTDSFYAYEMLLIENELKRNFRMSSIQKNTGIYSFDFNFSLPSRINLPLQAEFKCISNNWNIDKAMINENVDIGEELNIKLQGNFQEKSASAFPDLLFDISARDTILWGTEYSPAGFKNTRISFNLEDALYTSIIDNENGQASNDALSFLYYFKDSPYANTIIDQFWKTIRPANQNTSDLSLKTIDAILQRNDTDYEKFRFYPMQFLLNDFSAWEEWMKILNKKTIEERSIIRRNMIALPQLGITGGGMIRNWYVAGVFDNSDDKGFSSSYPPEKNPDIKDKYKNKYKETVSWINHSVEYDHLLNFIDMFDRNREGIVYAYCEIEASENCTVPVLAGSDDGIVVWINNKEIYRHNEGREAIRGQDIFTADFKKGVNKVLVKVSQTGGGWGLFVDVIDKDNVLKMP